MANQVFVANHKIDELEKILTSVFNTVIFTADGKAAISYVSNTYIEHVRTALEALDTQMQNLQNELTQPTLNYNPANLDAFLGIDFSIQLVKAQAISNGYNAFITGVGQINADYSNLSMFGRALRDQMNGVGFENVLLEDGFCDLEEIIATKVLEKANEGMEWGGNYKTKKDWMHIGIYYDAMGDYIQK